MASLQEYLSKHKCERPQLRMVSQDDYRYHFFCETCKEDWIITRSKLKAHARDEVFAQRIREATPAQKRKVFGRYYGGAEHA
jgi:hypothetical protein